MRRLVVIFAACAGAHARSPERRGPLLPCELRDYKIRSVTAITEHDGTKISVVRLRGAELLVEAQPGVTAEWLDLQLERHLEAARHARPTADCPLDVDGALVSVTSAGPGFVVRLRSDDEDEAGELLRRARGLAAH